MKMRVMSAMEKSEVDTLCFFSAFSGWKAAKSLAAWTLRLKEKVWSENGLPLYYLVDNEKQSKQINDFKTLNRHNGVLDVQTF